MGMSKHLSYLLILGFLATSCGDLFMNDKSGKKVSINQFATCKLDTKAFSYILSKNIKGDILCLNEQLHMFMDIVDTDRPGFISKKTLVEFIKDGPMNLDQKILSLLDGFFDLSYIILGGDRGYIARKDVDKLTDMMIYFNEHIWKIYRFFTSEDEVNYARHSKERAIVYNEFLLLSKEVQKIFKRDRENFSRISLEKFVDSFFWEQPNVLSKIRSLLFVKKIFLGGVVPELDHLEFGDLLSKVPTLATVAFDFVKLKNFNFTGDQQILLKVLLEDVTLLKSKLFYGPDSLEAIMTIPNLTGAIAEFFPDFSIDLTKYHKEIATFKEPILGSGGEFINNRELIRAFEHGVHLLSKGEMYFRIYDYFADELNKTDPITHDFSDFPVSSSYELDVVRDFSRVVHNYQFMKGSFRMPLFHHQDYRNANGYFQIMMIEYGVTQLMAFFGGPHENARGGYHLTLEQTYQVMLKLKWFLKDMGIITIGKKGGGEVKSATDNLVLMSTLFQYQADGCGASDEPDVPCMEVPEITEFLVGLLAAVDVKDFFIAEMQKQCADEMDEYDRIYVSCFRKKFINVLEAPMEDGRALSYYMPLMYDYIKSITKDIPEGGDPTESKDFLKFLQETEHFTRICDFYDKTAPDPEPVPMKATDAFGVFAGLINIESTMIRHDANKNNKLDGLSKDYSKNEVLHAYNEVYQGAIKGLVAPNGGFMEKLAKPIFLYLIKYGKVPDTSQFKSIWQFVKFMLKLNKRADASRTTIATILKVIGQQNPGNPFKCEECLRDPTKECVPEGDEWND